MFKSRRQLKKTIADLSDMLDLANRNYDSLFQEAAANATKAEEERRDLCDELAEAYRNIQELKDEIEVQKKIANKSRHEAEEEREQRKLAEGRAYRLQIELDQMGTVEEQLGETEHLLEEERSKCATLAAEAEELRRRLSRKHCDTTAKKWKKQQQTKQPATEQ